VSFDDGSLAAEDRCNTMRGGYEIDDEVLVVVHVTQRQMSCDDGGRTQNPWVAELQQGGATLTLAGARTRV
jgi:heat shock protein HslJ